MEWLPPGAMFRDCGFKPQTHFMALSKRHSINPAFSSDLFHEEFRHEGIASLGS